MGEVSLEINGRNYGIVCDDGQEDRVAEVGQYVNQRARDIAAAGAAANDTHLLALTSLLLADEIKEMQDNGGTAPQQAMPQPSEPQRVSEEEERLIIEAIDHLASHIETVADRMQKI